MAVDMNMNVLIVDDYKTMLRIIENLLKQLGFKNVHQATDGAAALKELLIAERSLPESADVHFQLSQAYRRAGQRLEANRELAEFERLKARQGPLFVPPEKP